tara:strand:+ start:92 stop:688 length:597 start_codon:yes stop_codon:yes gene_type:complete
MLFKTHQKSSFISKIFNFLWPKKGWKRIIKYTSLRLKRLPGSPHSIALGFTFGVTAALTPLFGLHFLIGIFLAWLFRVSMVASLIGNLLGNPWTFPFICIFNFKVGMIFYNSSAHIDVNMKLLSNELYLLWNTVYKLFIEFNYIQSLSYLNQLKLIPPMLLGSLFSIIIIGVPCYFLSRFIITNYRNKIKLFKNNNKV